MHTINTPIRLVMLLLSTAILSACQNDQQTSATDMKFTTPSRILQVRAVDVDQLQPLVTLSNGDNVIMERNSDNEWTGTLQVQPNNTYFVFVTWVETLTNGNLVLAEWSENVEVDDTGAQVNLGSNDYDYSADFDGDTIANIDERQNNTDPFSANGQLIGDTSDEQSDSNNETPDSSDSNSNDVTNNDVVDDEPTSEETIVEEMEDSDSTEVIPDTSDDANNEQDDTDTADDDQTDDDADDTDDTNEDESEAESDPKSEIATVIIPRIAPARAPLIDGLGARTNAQDKLIGEWANAVQFDINDNPLLINNLMIDNTDELVDGAPYRSWAAMHDGINLYVLVLLDDIGARHGDSANVWEDDAVELFIDADNSKLPVWGDADDFHYMIPLLKLDRVNANRASDGRIDPGPMSSDVELSIDFHTGPKEGPDGIRFPQFEQDVYEIAIPLAEAGIQPGQVFGFELQVDDDDDGAGREAKWGWFHPSRVADVNTDTTYKDPSVMGTVVLEE